jgi:hypothetical protein
MEEYDFRDEMERYKIVLRYGSFWDFIHQLNWEATRGLDPGELLYYLVRVYKEVSLVKEFSWE